MPIRCRSCNVWAWVYHGEIVQVKCKLCDLPLGESSQEITDIICLFCIDERNEFYGTFGNEPPGLGTEWISYWDSVRRWIDPRDRTFYLHQRREIQASELMQFMRRLKWKCDTKEEL